MFNVEFLQYMQNSNFLENQCPVNLINSLLNHLTDSCNRNFERKETNLTGISLRCPWVDSNLEKCIKKRYKIFKNYKENLIPYKNFTEYRNMLNKAVVLARKIYHLKKFANIDKDPRKAWKVINKHRNNKKDTTKFKIKMPNKQITENTDFIWNEFSEYYFESVKVLTQSNTDYGCDLSQTIV